MNGMVSSIDPEWDLAYVTAPPGGRSYPVRLSWLESAGVHLKPKSKVQIEVDRLNRVETLCLDGRMARWRDDLPGL